MPFGLLQPQPALGGPVRPCPARGAGGTRGDGTDGTFSREDDVTTDGRIKSLTIALGFGRRLARVRERVPDGLRPDVPPLDLVE